MRALAKLRLPALTALRKTEASLWGDDCFASPVLLCRLAVSSEPNPAMTLIGAAPQRLAQPARAFFDGNEEQS